MNNNNNEIGSQTTQDMEKDDATQEMIIDEPKKLADDNDEELAEMAQQLQSSDSEDYEGETDEMNENEVDELLNGKKKKKNTLKKQASDILLPPNDGNDKQKNKKRRKRIVRVIEDVDIQLPTPKIKPHLPPFYKDKWEPDYVKLPCSPQNIYTNPTTGKKLSRWYLIQTMLSSRIHSSTELEEAIRAYNFCYDLSALHCLLNEILDEEETRKFFAETLPSIAALALRLPELIPTPIPILVPHKDQELTLTQTQIACLLANAFFCTLPSQGGNLIIEEEVNDAEDQDTQEDAAIVNSENKNGHANDSQEENSQKEKKKEKRNKKKRGCSCLP